MAKKLSEYNHRFNDLAEVLRSHYEPSLLQDKIAALIQPVRDSAGAAAVVSYEHSASDTDSASTSSSAYTSIVNKPTQRRFGRTNSKTLEQRAKKLQEDMDIFRDECKL